MEWNTRKRPYRCLAKTKSHSTQVREYPPARRSVKIGSKLWTLPFPYLIAIAQWEDYDDPALSVALAKRSVLSVSSVVYHPILPHSSEEGRICLSEGAYRAESLDEIVDNWRNTKFCVFGGGHCSQESVEALKMNYGRLASWSRLEEQQAIEQLCYKPMLLRDFVANNVSSSRKLHWLKSIRKRANSTDRRAMEAAQLDKYGVWWGEDY
jgi:hypothetical protein